MMADTGGIILYGKALGQWPTQLEKTILDLPHLRNRLADFNEI